MGLDDQAEKKRQAEEWVNEGTPEQQAAARDYLAWLEWLECPYGCMPMDHGC